MYRKIFKLVSMSKKKKVLYFVNLTWSEKVYMGLQFYNISTIINKYYIWIKHYNFHDIVNFILPNLVHIFWFWKDGFFMKYKSPTHSHGHQRHQSVTVPSIKCLDEMKKDMQKD